MTDWTVVAERLNVVKNARDEFLVREVLDEWIIGPMLLDRLAADLSGNNGVSAESTESAGDGPGGR